MQFSITPADYEKIKDSLPESVKGMIAVIGMEAVLKLINFYGGLTIPMLMGRTKSSRAKLDKFRGIIGDDAAEKFQRAFLANEDVFIPRCDKAKQMLRNISISNEFDSMLAEGDTAQEAVFFLSLKYELSDRQIWRILKKNP